MDPTEGVIEKSFTRGTTEVQFESQTIHIRLEAKNVLFSCSSQGYSTPDKAHFECSPIQLCLQQLTATLHSGSSAPRLSTSQTVKAHSVVSDEPLPLPSGFSGESDA